MSIAILIAVYNEAKHLKEVLQDVLKQGYPILVVDDGSTDGTPDIAKEVQGVELLELKTNQGKGMALRRGFDHLIQKNVDWILIMDGDGQHLPNEIPLFIKDLNDHQLGVVNGNRLSERGQMPALRYWTNRGMSYLISKMTSLKIQDAQCGFKLLSTQFLKQAKFTAEKFEIEDDLLLEAHRLGFKIRYVPVTAVYGSETSHIHPLRDTWRFIKFLMSWKKKVKT